MDKIAIANHLLKLAKLYVASGVTSEWRTERHGDALRLILVMVYGHDAKQVEKDSRKLIAQASWRCKAISEKGFDVDDVSEDGSTYVWEVKDWSKVSNEDAKDIVKIWTRGKD